MLLCVVSVLACYLINCLSVLVVVYYAVVDFVLLLLGVVEVIIMSMFML